MAFLLAVAVAVAIHFSSMLALSAGLCCAMTRWKRPPPQVVVLVVLVLGDRSYWFRNNSNRRLLKRAHSMTDTPP